MDSRDFELTEIDRIRIADTVRTLCLQRVTRLASQSHQLTAANVNPDEAVGLAVTLYDTAATFGISPGLLDAATETSIPDMAIAALALRSARGH